jgi:hypothetical protein
MTKWCHRCGVTFLVSLLVLARRPVDGVAGCVPLVLEVARFVAAFDVITTDAQISIYNAKYKYLFWRPYTAITTGDYLQDPTWTSFLAAPQHPEYPSGHGGQIGSQQGVLDLHRLEDDHRRRHRRSRLGGRALPHLGHQGVDQGLRVARWEVGRLAEIGLDRPGPR